MRSRALVLLLVGLTAAAAVYWFARHREGRAPGAPPPAAAASAAVPPPAPATSPGPVTSQRQVVQEIIQGGVTPDLARQLFSMALGPLPGVEMPAGARDAGDFDGTFAVQEIYQVWGALTPEQRRAAALLIDKPTATGNQRGALTMPGPSSVRRSPADPFSRFAVVPTALRVPGDDTPAYDYNALAVAANTELGGHLKQPFIDFVISVDYGPPTGTEYAHTTSWWSATDQLGALG